MVDWKKYAIGTLTIFLIVSLGFNVMPDDTHFCRVLEISKECNRLSSTEKTCYPYPETTVGKKYCNSGWELLLAEEEIKVNSKARQWSCSPPPEYSCTEIR